MAILQPGMPLIEASYSSIVNEPTGVAGSRQKKEIHRARIYCISGYYDENEKYIPRPDCLTKVYHSLVRYVKKDSSLYGIYRYPDKHEGRKLRGGI